MPDNDCEIIREQLSDHEGSKVGFVIFRCSYKSDSEWTRFMEHLNKLTRQILDDVGEGDLFEYIDWDVQEGPQLENALSSSVREHFQQWCQNNTAPTFTADPRRAACLAVNQVHIDQVLSDMELEDPLQDGSAWIDLISIDEEEGYTGVKLTAIFPRVYSLVLGLDWEGVYAGEGGIFDE